MTAQQLEVEVATPDDFTISVRDGRMLVRSGPSESLSTARLHCSAAQFVDLSLGAADLSGELNAQDVSVDGDIESLSRLFDHFAATANERLSHA